MINLREVFAKIEAMPVEYRQFEKIDKRLHDRPDICGLIYLDRLLPSPKVRIIVVARHEQIWLGTNTKDLAKVATEDDVLYLVRCGIFYDDDIDSLTMFV
jgi:hypothetical protein